MGQARARGTFEERKAKAIEEGRKKIPTQRIRVAYQIGTADEAIAMMTALMIGSKYRR